MRWLRLYDDTINDPKILKLPEATRWYWIALLCIASKNEGTLPLLDDIAIQIRATPAKATEIIASLVKAGLLDKTENGFAPHNWNGRQYKSDVSTDRVKRFRNGQRNVSETLDETEVKRPQIQRQNTETEKRESGAVASAPSPIGFDQFWRAIPKRAGANPKAPAEKLFAAAVKAGTPSEVIIAAATRWAIADASKVGTEFLPQAVKWLRDRRWIDYGPELMSEEPAPEINWEAQILRFRQGYQWSTKWYGPEPGALGCRAPADLLLRHGYGPIDQFDDPPRLQSMQ